MWNDKLELLGRLYTVSDIQYYFEYIIKNDGALLGHTIETPTDNPPKRIYVNNI